LFDESDDGSFSIALGGVILLFISACSSAIQHVLEERVYRNDPKVRAIDMMMMESLWKILIICCTLPIFVQIPVSTEINSSGVLENNADAIYEVLQSPMLLHLVLAYAVCGALGTFIVLTIIKLSNAMQKVMLASVKTFAVWLFFLCW